LDGGIQKGGAKGLKPKLFAPNILGILLDLDFKLRYKKLTIK